MMKLECYFILAKRFQLILIASLLISILGASTNAGADDSILKPVQVSKITYEKYSSFCKSRKILQLPKNRQESVCRCILTKMNERYSDDEKLVTAGVFQMNNDREFMKSAVGRGWEEKMFKYAEAIGISRDVFLSATQSMKAKKSSIEGACF